MTLIENYSLIRKVDGNFEFKMVIPDNCNYSTSCSSSIYRVAIQLNSGQTKPSTNFTNVTIAFAPILDQLQIWVDQMTPGLTVTKPKVAVENC